MNCPNCHGPMELHNHQVCVMNPEPHWYCLTANCGTVVKIPSQDGLVSEPT